MTKNEGKRMTKEQREIIETINNIPVLLDGNKVSEEDSIKISVALVKAIQALKQPFDQILWERDCAIAQLKELGYGLGERIRTSDDCRSIQDVIGYLCSHCPDDAECFEYCDDIKNLKALPSVTPTHGKMLVCPNCGLDVHSDFKYCPRCGERMRGA